MKHDFNYWQIDMKILVTGATGNLGREVARQLELTDHEVVVGTRDGSCPVGASARTVTIDFNLRITAAERFDGFFLVRPPEIVDPELFAYFLAPHDRSTLIVFLSVLGADKKAYFPHAKIEKRTAAMGFRLVAVRPCYFMDNLLTTLWGELATNRRIYLPVGELKLDWVSARDVAAVSALALTGCVPENAVTVCSGVEIGFDEVCEAINLIAGSSVAYQRASIVGYVFQARKSGMSWSFIMVMLLLHFLPRIGKKPQTDCTKTVKLLRRNLETLDEFIVKNQSRFAILK